MPLSYCSLHQRLFVTKEHAWTDYPLEKIQYIKELSALYRVKNPHDATLEVFETPCDHCHQAILHIFHT